MSQSRDRPPPKELTTGEAFVRLVLQHLEGQWEPPARRPRAEPDLDRRARKLAEEHGAFILTVLERRGCGAAAEDLRQNVLWIVADRQGREPPLENVRGYISRVADNQARNYKALREHDAERAPAEPSEAAAGPDPEAAAARRELWRRLFRYIDKLPEEQRRLIHLLDFEGLTLDEVAEQLGRSRSAIAREHERATDALRRFRLRSDEETESGQRIKPPR